MDLNVLKRFLNHSASSEDYKKINQWRSEDPSNSNFLFALEELWSKKDEAKYATKRHLKISYQKMMKKEKICSRCGGEALRKMRCGGTREAGEDRRR